MPAAWLRQLRFLLSVSLAGCFVAAGTLAQDPQADKAEDETPVATDEADESITVTAGLEEIPSAPHGASSTVLRPESIPTTRVNLTDLAVDAPGVSENGQGGLFQNISIRGVSRQRITHQIAGMRITSERRAGVSTSFVDPLLIGSVEVLRGPSTTFNGSGALGGIVQILPRNFVQDVVTLGYDSIGDQRYVAAGTGIANWSIGLAGRAADNGEGGDGSELFTRFTQFSSVIQRRWRDQRRSYELMFMPSYGDDIGKANSDFPNRTTTYPVERHQLLKFAIHDDRDWRLDLYAHAHDLTTDVVQATSRSEVRNDTLDYGARFERQQERGPAWSWRYGLDAFGRSDVDARETLDDLVASTQTVSQTLDGAHSLEGGAFGVLRYEAERTTVEGGARFSWVEQSNGLDGSRDKRAWNGFLGVSRQIRGGWQARGGASTGLRFASLSELFFSGTTGRGEVEGNPALDSERSFNVDAALRWVGRRALVQFAVFRNRIDDYIERIEFAPDQLTFVNLTSGTIEGLELQTQLHPAVGWSISLGGHLLEGRDSADAPLADIPVDELFALVNHKHEAWQFDLGLRYRAHKTDFGSGESAIPTAKLIDGGIQYNWGLRGSLTLGFRNLLDEVYFRSADDKAPLAPGRSFSLRWTWTGS